MACLSYNGICLPFSEVSSFSMRAEYDDQSQTDKILTKFDITVNTLITADALDMIAPAWDGLTSDPALIMAVIHESLMMPRRRLSFQFNDYEFIPQPAGVRGFVDARNGPIPQAFTPIRMDELSWWCSYQIVAHYVVNYRAVADDDGRITMTNLPGNAVLYNRWDESVAIDKCQYSTRTRNGKCMIRSDNQEGFIADEVRSQMAIVGVPKGFVREDAKYTVSPDGLGLSYSVVDQEVFEMPPEGAYDADGEFSENLSKGDGKRTASCTVTLKGPKNVKRSLLAQKAVSLCAATLNARQAARGPLFNAAGETVTQRGRGKGVVLGGSLSFQMWKNQVTASLQAMTPNNHVWFGSPQLTQFIDTPPGGVSAPQPKYYDRGTAGLLLQAAAYYDPTLRGVVMTASPGYATDNPVTPPDGRGQLSLGTLPGKAGVLGG